MPENNNVWCVLGPSGSGKTTICDELSREGEFKHIDRDAFYLKSWNDLGGDFESFKRLLQKGDRKSKREIIRSLRKKIEKLLYFFSNRVRMGIPLPEVEKNFQIHIEFLTRSDDNVLIDYFTKNGEGNLYLLICALSENEGLAAAIRETKTGPTDVLYNSASLIGPFFDLAKDTFHHQGVKPSIIIVRNRIQKIIDTALERAKANADKNQWKGRAEAALQTAGRVVDFSDIEKVIICDNTGEISVTVSTIRGRILSGDFEKNVEWPIPLVSPEL